MSAIPYIKFSAISKTFSGVTALQNITFSCERGTVHALMGENGAGKSTLLKILSGFHEPTTGTLEIAGQPVRFSCAADALEAGIAVIYQELHLVPEMSVAENIYLGQLPTRNGIVDKKRLRDEAIRQLQHLGLQIDPDTPLKCLSIGQWQMVEIAKALTRDAQVIAFDEPTSSLSAREIEQLFRVIKELRQQGKVILYVSHRMEEVFHLADEITVFKDGRYVTTFDGKDGVTHDELVQAMVGREIGDIYGYRDRTFGDVRFEVVDFLAPGLSEPVSFSVRRGEVVGLFGLVGAGRTELLKGIFGATQSAGGLIRIDGCPISIKTPLQAINYGLVLCPEDRKAEGIIPIHSVQDNINISARSKHLKLGSIVDDKWEEMNAVKMIDHLGVKTASPHQRIKNLSGGNQQKAILGRWLSVEMKVMLLDEPTRGIDVGAKHEIYGVIYQLASQGIAVVFASSDLPEALGIADRIIVMREGKISGELMHNAATEEKALSLAMLNRPLVTVA